MSIRPAVTVAPVDGNAWQHIETQLLTGAAASITFSTGLTHDLYRLYVAIDNNAAATPRHRFNNDATAANYDSQTSNMAGSSGTGTHSQVTAITAATVREIADGAGDSAAYMVLAGKSVTGEDGAWFGMFKENATTSLTLNVGGGQWDNAAAKITRIDMVSSTGSFYGTDTSARLEGLAVA